jgi:hypothetical protein
MRTALQLLVSRRTALAAHRASGMPIIVHRRFIAWIILIAIFSAYIISIVRLHPTNIFGLSEDDAIYFTSAQALAQGHGYILPSIPGTPSATKYPILYPLILSAVWRLSPSFPGNLVLAIAVTVAFGIWFIAAVFFFFHSFKTLSDAECLVLTAFCALHPLVIFYGGSILSDIPFAALALTAMILADKAIHEGSGTPYVVMCAVFAGLSILMRLFGLPIVAGIIAAAIARRMWKPLLVFIASISPFVLIVAWRILHPVTSIAPVSGPSASSLGWAHTWAYYTSYWTMWKISVPNIHIFWAMLQNNGVLTVSGPANFFLAPMFVHNTLFGRATVAVIGLVTLAGIVRHGKLREWSAVHFSLPFYLAAVLLWNYADANNRYLLPYWPLFAAGLWLELRHLLKLIAAQLSTARAGLDKIVVMLLGGPVLVLMCAIAVNYMWGTRELMRQESGRRGALLKGKQAAYDWLAKNAAPDARVVAYEDPSVYLYSGRMAMRPIFFSTAEQFDAARLTQALMHIGDVPQAIGADYWIASADDFQNEWPSATAGARQFLSQLAESFAMVYHSSDDRVHVYSLNRFGEGRQHNESAPQ